MEQARVHSYWTPTIPVGNRASSKFAGILLQMQGIGYRKVGYEESLAVPRNKITREEVERGRREGLRIYSRERRNSNPKRRISPIDSWRKTLATMGGVSLGMRLEEAGEGAGMVKWTN